jgi:hypothetical protein
MRITFKDKARADEKAQHTREYVSILKRLATHLNEYNITGSPVMRGNTVIGR